MERRLTTILAVDAVGYSRLMGVDEAGTLAALKKHRAQLIDPKLAQYNGRTVKLMGDGALMEFPSVVDAVTFAVDVQCAMSDRNLNIPEEQRILFRMGINIGDVIVEGKDIYGDGVNLAARLEGLAEPGGICIRRNVRNQIRDKLDLNLDDMGELRAKNIERPVRAFRILLDEKAKNLITRTPSQTVSKQFQHRIPTVAGLILILFFVAAVAWWQRWLPDIQQFSGMSTALPLPDKPSLAVLPFANLSNDETQEYFADGLTDDLITDLSKLSGLFVIARNSVFTFKGKPTRVEEVAAELGVHYVVEGSVRRAGNKLRVNAKLISGETGLHIWAERYEREITDIFAVQDELIRQIVAELAVQLTTSEQYQLSHRPAPDLKAYDLYLQAREGHFSRDQARMRESLSLYAQSWNADPKFAEAYAGYARLSADIWRLSSLREGMGGAVARKSAEVAARRAMAIDPTLGDTYSVLSLLRMVEHENSESIRLAEQAVELDPNSAEAHAVLAIVLIYAGQHAEALKEIQTSVRLNPRPAPYHSIYHGLALFFNNRFDDAIAVLEPIANTRDRGLGDAPLEILAMAYARTGRIDEARSQIDALRMEEPFLNLAYYRLVYDHHARNEDLQNRLDALEMAGLPKWPLGFDGKPEERLIGSKIKMLINGKTWSGRDAGRQLTFIQEFGENESTVYAAANVLLNGSAFIAEDELCEQYEGFVLSRNLCGPSFKNLDTSLETEGEYVYVNPATVRYFSLSN